MSTKQAIELSNYVILNIWFSYETSRAVFDAKNEM